MKTFVSTRSFSKPVNAFEAIVNGISPDGGLYVPTEFESMDIDSLLDLSPFELSARILYTFLGGFTYEEYLEIVTAGYSGKFSNKELTPLKALDDRYILELFYGPTAAFKDVALCLLPHLITRAAKKLGIDDEIRILTATSGDTGKAALAGFADAPGTSINVFYPHGGVSEVQKLQMATQEGENVKVFAVKGNFDDTQTGVKKIFGDNAIKEKLLARKIRLSSANSINLGRLAPQIAYYFSAYVSLVKSEKINIGDKVDYCVPTGNFGDILAGYYAKRMGLPVGRLICASNANKVLTDFFETGVYDRRREFYLTASPSMDILISSNFERCLYHMSDPEHVKGFMDELTKNGIYKVDNDMLKRMREVFDAGTADDRQAFDEIRRVWEKDNYLLDTHTAVASCVANDLKGDAPMVVLSTASPYKFAPAVLKALGKDGENSYESLKVLNALTGVAVPEPLKGLDKKPVLHSKVIEKYEMPEVIL